MKRNLFALSIGSFLFGTGIGVIEAGKWLHSLVLPGSPWSNIFDDIHNVIWLPSSFSVVGFILICYGLSGIFGLSVSNINTFKVLLSILSGASLCLLVTSISGIFRFMPLSYLLVFSLIMAISISVLFYLFTPPRNRYILSCGVKGLIIASIWTILALFLYYGLDNTGKLSFGGLGIFRSLSYPPLLREYPSIFQDLSGGALYGASIGAFFIWFTTKSRLSIGILWGISTGLWVSGVFYIAHMLIGTLIMRSAYSEVYAFYVSIIVVLLAVLISITGIVTFSPVVKSKSLKCVAMCFMLAPLIVSGLYIIDLHKGEAYYLAAIKTPLDRTREYIHFSSNGGWTRTFEPNADSHKIYWCDRLLREYPNSIYASQALYLKAKCQFTSWQFSDAIDSLRLFKSSYHDLRGSSSLLYTYAQLAQGNFKEAINFNRNDPVFDQWQNVDGLLLLAYCYEIIGNFDFALGYYTKYINIISANYRNAWRSNAIQYAEIRTGNILSSKRAAVRRATVRGKVMDVDLPLAGIYVGLVQPHIDASAPDDSHQFSSAITLPLWFGLGATTDSNGEFVINNVPFGKYEVVVGFDTATLPAERVISRPISPINIDSTSVRLPEIAFTPCIKLNWPINSTTVSADPVLRWTSYPGAASYTVSITSHPILPISAKSTEVADTGYQCWVRSRVKDNMVKVTADGFSSANTLESKKRKLVPGRRYSWLVLAYDSQGNIISSSERYRLDEESSFLIQSDDSKGG